MPPSLETAVRALLGSPGSRSPPPTIPWCGSRKSTVNAPALGELNNGVSYAFQVLPWSCGKDPGDISAASGNPRVPPTLRCDASSARREGGFTGQGRRHVAADVLPCHSVGCAKIVEHSIDRVAMQNSAVRRPKREPVIETSGNLVLELDRPSGAAVQCLVNTEISRVIPNRHQIRNARAESLHVAKLQSFGARDDARVPSLPAVSGDGECAVATGCPDHSWIHGPHCDQAVGRPAILRS